MKIEKNIPISGGTALGKTRDCEIIFNKFEIGDSSLINSEYQATYRVILDRIVRKNKSSKKFTFKAWDKENHRVWRIA